MCGKTHGTLPVREAHLSLSVQISIKAPHVGMFSWLPAWLISVSSSSRGWLILYDPKPSPQISLLLFYVASSTLNHIVRLSSVTQGPQANKDTTARYIPRGWRSLASSWGQRPQIFQGRLNFWLPTEHISSTGHCLSDDQASGTYITLVLVFCVLWDMAWFMAAKCSSALAGTQGRNTFHSLQPGHFLTY